MTQLLVSVRNAAEAREALAGGAAVIDVKEPRRGALGPAAPATWAEVRATVGRRTPVSAALGELLFDRVVECVERSVGLEFIKVGLAGCAQVADWPQRWERVLQQVPERVAPVAVAYADYGAARSPAPESVLRWAVKLGCRALLVDTFGKANGGLFAHLSPDRLRCLSLTARQHEMIVALAGSIDERSVADALRLSPDYIAVRGAVCCGGRTGSVTRALVQRFCDLIVSRNID